MDSITPFSFGIRPPSQPIGLLDVSNPTGPHSYAILHFYIRLDVLVGSMRSYAREEDTQSGRAPFRQQDSSTGAESVLISFIIFFPAFRALPLTFVLTHLSHHTFFTISFPYAKNELLSLAEKLKENQDIKIYFSRARHEAERLINQFHHKLIDIYAPKRLHEHNSPDPT